jgi:signal transduction histidine kinase
VFGLAAGALAHREARARADLALALQTLAETQSRRLAEARQDERLDIARDLHDELGHGLMALLLTLSATDRVVNDADVAVQRADATRLAAGLLDRLRAVVGQMREPVPSALALVPALQDLVSAVADRRFEIRLAVEGCEAPVEGSRALAVLRLVQEAITNAVRHGGQALSIIEVRVGRAAQGGLTVAVRDDGSGAETVTPGNGLKGMRERLARLGGSIRWHSSAGGGFQLDAELPGGSAP